MKSKTIVAVGVAVSLSLAAWLFATPYLALSAMKQAADARDAAALANYIDFPQFRASLKANLQSHITTATRALDNPLVSFGAALAGSLAGSLADPLIDAMVTPESLALLFRGQAPAPGQAAEPTTEVDTSMGYAGLNEFVVDVKQKGATTAPIELVLVRNGLSSWKLTSVRLP